MYWFWNDSLKAREAALGRCASACRQLDMQFLDQTVGVKRLGLARLAGGSLRIRREFGFEFSSDGVDRREGRITMVSQQVLALYMQLPDGGTYLDGGVVKPLRLH